MSEHDDDNASELFTQRLRLNKFLAERGICSRRDADLWIESGRVTVNDEYADVGAYVDDSDQVRVDGELIAAFKIPRRVYIALNKPIDIECTTDTRIDGNIIDFVGHHERIFPIGRLDKDSDGLIFLTNDGDIVNKILRAEHNHEKEYLVTVDHKITPEFLRGMAQGVRILRRTTKPCKTYKVAAMTFGIVLTEGMNRQIRKMAEAFNYEVLKLTRVRIMNVTLGHLKLGRWRNLTPTELVQLRAAAAAPKVESTPLARGSRRAVGVTRTAEVAPPRRKPLSDAKPSAAFAAKRAAPARKISAASGVDKPKRSANPSRIWADATAAVSARGERKTSPSERPRAERSERGTRSEAERSEFFGQRNQPRDPRATAAKTAARGGVMSDARSRVGKADPAKSKLSTRAPVKTGPRGGKVVVKTKRVGGTPGTSKSSASKSGVRKSGVSRLGAKPARK
jgi:23S rRNA pseudouridine2604 synthase